MYNYFHSFPKVRAIWAIVRNGSVVWNANLRGTGAALDTRCGKTARGIVIVHNLLINDRPVELEDFTPADLPGIDGNVSVRGDQDAEVTDGG